MDSSPSLESERALDLALVKSIHEIPEADWDALLGEGQEASPFLEWRFLASLEDAGTLGERKGWVPIFITLRHEGRLVAAVPSYIKFHSMGEFVYDHAWAEFADRNGVSYYPKLLVGVPFTPVTGRRLLTAPGEPRALLLRALGKVLKEVAEGFNLSGAHINFAMPDEIEALKEVGFLERLGLQYHFNRKKQGHFDEYLGRFNSKRRNQLKRECRAVDQHGLTIRTLKGEELNGRADLAYKLYVSTVDKFYWGRRYLNPKTFELWTEKLSDRMELVVAEKADGKVIAGAVNFSKGKRLYGRYWGCFEEYKHLHFNVCYYQGVKECFTREIDVFEPGAGGEHKLVRGFEPTIQQSAHYLCHPGLHEAIGQHLEYERQMIEEEQQSLLA